MMPIKTLRRWARKFRGYVFTNNLSKAELIERILAWEAERAA